MSSHTFGSKSQMHATPNQRGGQTGTVKYLQGK